jgi:branched-chain amino acid transport system substrate-binding protein
MKTPTFFSLYSMLRLLAALFAIILFPHIALSNPLPTVKIGVLLALTGPYPTQGNAFREGIQLAEAHINASGGINGRPFRVVIEDTVNDPKTALTAAKKLIAKDHVIAALMSSYPEYQTGGMEFQRNKVPVIAIWDSSPELDQMGDWIFGIGPWVPSSGEVSAEFAASQITGKRAVIINSIDPWADLVAGYFEKKFTSLGGTVVKRFQINPDTSDFRTVLISARVTGADVLFAPIIDHIPDFHRQKRQTGWSVPTISSDVIAQEHIDAAPEALEGVYLSKNKDPIVDGVKPLYAEYRKRFGHEPGLPWFVSTGYDGVMLLVTALRSGCATGEEIRNFLSHLRGYKGETQEYNFTPEGSAPQMAVIYQIRKGKLDLAWEPGNLSAALGTIGK